MSSESKKYIWQEIVVSPDNVFEILDQMEFLEKILDCDPHGLVIDFEEQQAIHEELSRLSSLIPVALDTEMSQRLEAAAKLSRQYTGGSEMSFREASYEFRRVIWLMVFGLLLMLMTAFVMPLTNRDLPWMIPLLLIMLLLYIAWAVWASRLQK